MTTKSFDRWDFLWMRLALLATAFWAAGQVQAGSRVVRATEPTRYPDGRPAARYRLEASDQGVIFRHGTGPDRCDDLGARDVWVWAHDGAYYLHYDGAGPKGWLACLATSQDLTHWTARGPVLELGAPGAPDSASASYGVTFFDGTKWHLFYMGTPNTSAAPERVPAFPYLTLKADAASPTGPWKKRYEVTPFAPQPNTYYSVTASPGHVVRQGDDYLMFFSAAVDQPVRRTIGLARTRDLDGPWTLESAPILPLEEQIENTALYYEKQNQTWFLFTNHVGLRDGLEYTDAIWVYWTKDLNRWNPSHKAVVLDGRNCKWSKHIIGLPSVVVGRARLALIYDGSAAPLMPMGIQSHMHRDLGMAWLDLPLLPPQD